MKIYATVIMVIGALLLFVAACAPAPTASPVPSTPTTAAPSMLYQPFPDGYGYMQENDALKEAVKQGDHATVRQHGWSLWAGIMQPAQGLDWPVWYTWPNGTGAFAPDMAELANAQANPTKKSLIAQNTGNVISDKIPLPYYPIPQPVLNQYPTLCQNPTDPTKSPVCADGSHVAFNGDIMIPTESLSMEAFDWIRDPKQPVYKQSTLNKLHEQGVHELNLPERYIVTKHMFWPVKATGLSAIPVWHEDQGPDYPGYAGYETWPNLVAVDPSGKQVGQTAQVSFLYGVFQTDRKTPIPTVSAQAKVYSLDDFYYHQVTQADWDSFNDADKAIINASSYWAYNQPFSPGDYLVTVAMHVNTKEIPTWALQSVWWSDQPDQGIYAENRPQLPQAKGPWKHYLMVDSYGIPAAPGGDQPVAFNPYIELVIHPVGTNCNTCHNRAGWPTGSNIGQASYQNADCPSLLATLSLESACLQKLTLTDFQWIIPDRAIAP